MPQHKRKRADRPCEPSRPPLSARQKRSAVLWYLLLLIVCALPHVMGFLLMTYAGDRITLYLLLLYAGVPLTAAIMPFAAAYHRAEPLLTFFPAGLMLLFSPVYQAAGLAVGMFLLSLVTSVAGQEARKRRPERQKGVS